jgi:hypothetical protein
VTNSKRLERSLASAEARFWERVQVVAECWLWKGARKNGYGVFLIAARPTYAHQFSYRIHHGEIPSGKVVRHRCDVKLCVRADHLELGSQADNVGDMWDRGQAKAPPRHFGLANSNAHLSDERVEELRARWFAGGVQQREIAAEFGVSQSTVWRLIHRVVRA